MSTFGKKIVLTLILIVLFLGLTILGFLFLKDNTIPNQEEKEKETPKERGSVSGTEEKSKEGTKIGSIKEMKDIKDVYEKASSTQDVEMCQQMSNKRSADICVKNIAIATKDKESCEQVKDEKEKNDCVDKIQFRQMDEQSQDIKKCSEMLTEKYTKRCISRVASNLGQEAESNICEPFAGEVKDFCIENVGFKAIASEGNLGNCKNFSSKQKRMECIVYVADSLGVRVNKKDCNEFKNDLKSYCEQVVNN